MLLLFMTLLWNFLIITYYIITVLTQLPQEDSKNFTAHTGKAYTDDSINTVEKPNFSAVFPDIIRKGILSEKISIHTTEIIAIKINLKDIYKREDKW